MKAASTIGPYDVQIVDIPKPRAGPGTAVVRMLAVGICASDVQVYHGKHKYAKFPLIQGHEGIGIVQEAGAGVDLKAGDWVNIQQQFACGTCQACRKGRHNVCTSLKGVGILADGLFAEYFLSPAWNAVKVPQNFGVDRGMLVEPASVGVNSARVAGIRPGERVVVIGAGIIGNLTAQACRAMGAADVLVADIADAKLEMAAKSGIRHRVNSKNVDLKKAVLEAFGGELPDATFDCAGSEFTLKQAIDICANAGRAVIVANFKEPVTFDIPTFQRREVAILSVMGTVKDSTVEAIDLLATDRINIEGLITGRFPLDRIGEAYRYIDDNAATVMKAAIDIAEA